MSGLIVEDLKTNYFQLKSSSLFVTGNGHVATTFACLCYVNEHDDKVKAVFAYDNSKSFIIDFRATIKQQNVSTKHRQCSNEIESKDQNYLMINVGYIPPRALVMLEITVAGELEVAEQALVYKTPQTFTPSCLDEVISKERECQFHLIIKMTFPCQLAGCFSSSHAIQVDGDIDETGAKAVIITLAEDYRYDRDVEVHFYLAKPLDLFSSIEHGYLVDDKNSTKEFLTDLILETTKNRKTDEKCKNFPEYLLSEDFLYKTKSKSNSTQDYMKAKDSFEVEIERMEENIRCSKSKINFSQQNNQSHIPTFIDSKNLASSPKTKISNKKITDSTLQLNSCETRDMFRVGEKNIFNRCNVQLDGNDTKEAEYLVHKSLLKSYESCKELRQSSKFEHEEKNFKMDISKNNNINLDSILAVSLVLLLSNYPVCGEFIFMLDRSGSMSGSFITNTKECLVLFLKSLPTSCYFNIVSFGSYSQSLFPTSQRYSEDNLEKACEYLSGIKADMGGSELLQPLKAVLDAPEKTGHVRNIFIFTDGDVAQPSTILNFVKMKRRGARIFTFGIGPNIFYETVRNMAKFGNGKSYFAQTDGKIQTKMIECLKEFLRPTLCNVKVDWELPHNWCVIRPAPTIPHIVSGQRTNLYTAVVFPDKSHSSPVEETKSSSVKEFWFDEELESCQLGDELQCFKLEKSTLKSLRNDIDALMELNKSQLNLDDAIKNWRKTTQFHSTSSDTSTDTEDEYSRFSPPERDQSGITVDNSLNNNAHFKSKTNIVQEREYLISEDRPKKVFGEMNDVITHYMTNNAHFRSAFYANDIINRTKRENTIDVYKYVNSSSDVNETDNHMDFGWGCVSVTGYIGSDLYRKE